MEWINTALVMNVPEPDYDSTVGIQGASGSLTTPDGGTTWTAGTISIDGYTYTTGQ
jgi:hypothetical protein